MAQQWELAVSKASHLASAVLVAADDRNWEFVGTRGVLAVALAALGRQHAGGVEEVSLGSLLWHLSRLDGGVRELAVPLLGEKLAMATDVAPSDVDDGHDPIVATWLWLSRTWPAEPNQPAGTGRWDGMTRSVARGSAEPAVVVCLQLATEAICHALEEKLLRRLPRGRRVQAVGGEFDGWEGTVTAPAWELDDESRDLAKAALPHGYEVQLTAPDADEPVTAVLRPQAMQVILDDAKWEADHEVAYALDSWTRAERRAWVLTQRHIGYHSDDLVLYASGTSTTPEAVAERNDTWLPANRLLGLAIWRVARHEGLLIDEVELSRTLWWLDGSLQSAFFADPLPTCDPITSPVDGDWDDLQERGDELLKSSRLIVTWELHRDQEENRALRDADVSAELRQDPVLLGDRCRDIAAGPFRDGTPPRWTSAVEYATKVVTRAVHRFHSARWASNSSARKAAAELLPTLLAQPDAPAVPAEVKGHAWIQRTVRIDHIRTTLRTVMDHHKGEVGLDTRPEHPLSHAIAAVWNALDDGANAFAGLEELWAHRAVTVAAWDRRHMSTALREYVRALEELISTLCSLCFTLTMDQPEQP